MSMDSSEFALSTAALLHQQQQDYYTAMVLAACSMDASSGSVLTDPINNAAAIGYAAAAGFFPGGLYSPLYAAAAAAAAASLQSSGFSSSGDWDAASASFGRGHTWTLPGADAVPAEFHPYPASGSSHGSTLPTPIATPSGTIVKKYTHNPYASDAASNSNPSTAVTTPVLQPADSSLASSYAAGGSSTAPIYDPQYCETGSNYLSQGITEQFMQSIGSIANIACTPRGRYMLLAVIRLQHLDKISIIFDECLPCLWTVMIDPNGCQVVRFLVEYLTDVQVARFVECFDAEMVCSLATASQQTRRILQTLFDHHMNNPALQFFVDALANNSFAVSTTQQGCIAMMRVIENASPEGKLQVLNSLSGHLPDLSTDAFGNYVVQTILQQFDHDTLSRIIEISFQGYWINISCNKFGSNVMEKVVSLADPRLRDNFLREMCYNESGLKTLIQDGYGNFVLQAIIEACVGTPDGRKLLDLVRPLLATTPYGHKIEAKLKSRKFLGNAYNSSNVPAHGAHAHTQHHSKHFQ